jgi:methionyl-tRNA formyltransferase
MSGVSIMQLEAGLDTGPVYARESWPISAASTSADLHHELARLGARLLLQTLDNMEAGNAHAEPQPVEGVSYAAKLSKAEAPIDWQRSAAEIARQVQAFNPWPVAQCQWRGEVLRLWNAEPLMRAGPAALPGTVLGVHEGQILVACGTGVLGIQRLQAAGRRVLSAAEFANAQPLEGERFS